MIDQPTDRPTDRPTHRLTDLCQVPLVLVLVADEHLVVLRGARLQEREAHSLVGPYEELRGDERELRAAIEQLCSPCP